VISAAARRQICGVSGGRTSAELAHRLRGQGVVFSFQNTSREHSRTYEFIERLEQWLEQEIVLLEFRAPPRGEPPRFATFEIMDHRTLARDGSVFRDMLECLRTFRAKHKGLGPVAPWNRSRICTAYLKIKTQRRYCASLGWCEQGQARHLEYTEYLGLRADEPDRVSDMHKRNDALDTDERAPLAEAGVAKADILRAWAARPFDLGLTWEQEHLGNCTGCFEKDERDLASALIDPEGDPEWWIETEAIYGPMRRGGRPSYAQVYAEAPERMKIRGALAAGVAHEVIAAESALDKRRVKLIIRQELAPRQSFSCACDAAKTEDYDALIEAA